MSEQSVPKSIEWIGGLDGCVRMIDQTRLPGELVMLECRDAESVRQAVKRLSIRGAPAIGIAAAMGAVLGVRDYAGGSRDGLLEHLDKVCDHLATARPTAVNLSWALTRMRSHARSVNSGDVATLKQALLDEAKLIRDEDAAMCRAIGEQGRPLIKPGIGILTHCNAGALATAELGTALAPLYLAHQSGVPFQVFVGETRPLLQGSRLTAWELDRAGIDVTIHCDSMVGSILKEGHVNLIITGADRIAANGDTANKIGTYSVAVLAKEHGVPFYVAAPSTTFDLNQPDGGGIPIENRDPDEIRLGFGRPTAPPAVRCYCPAFDITPARLIRGLITDRGLIQPVNREQIALTLGDKKP